MMSVMCSMIVVAGCVRTEFVPIRNITASVVERTDDNDDEERRERAHSSGLRSLTHCKPEIERVVRVKRGVE